MGLDPCVSGTNARARFFFVHGRAREMRGSGSPLGCATKRHGTDDLQRRQQLDEEWVREHDLDKQLKDR